jgi:hypothetical protein
MTLFLQALVLGYGTAALAALGLSGAGLPLWAGILVVWIGGNVLGLGFALAGAALWPNKPERRASFTATEEEFRLWDEDLTWELVDAELRLDGTPASGSASDSGGLRAAG